MGRSFLSILLAGFLLAMATESRGYCWQPGMNPGFRGAPYVEQLSISTLRVDWTGITTMRHCADQFLVKYWYCGNTFEEHFSPMVSSTTNSVNIVLNRRGCVKIQAIAREDKGTWGVDYNKSPVVTFYPEQELW